MIVAILLLLIIIIIIIIIDIIIIIIINIIVLIIIIIVIVLIPIKFWEKNIECQVRSTLITRENLWCVGTSWISGMAEVSP